MESKQYSSTLEQFAQEAEVLSESDVSVKNPSKSSEGGDSPQAY